MAARTASNSMPVFLGASVLLHLFAAMGYHALPVLHARTIDAERELIRDDPSLTEEERRRLLEELERRREEEARRRAEEWWKSVVIPPVTVGDPDSTASGLTWIGVAEPDSTPHASPNPSEVDQPQLKASDAPAGVPLPRVLAAAAPSIVPAAEDPIRESHAPPGTASVPEPIAEAIEVADTPREEKRESPAGPSATRPPSPAPAPEVITRPAEAPERSTSPAEPKPVDAGDNPSEEASGPLTTPLNPEAPIADAPPVAAEPTPREAETRIEPLDPGDDLVTEPAAGPPETAPRPPAHDPGADQSAPVPAPLTPGAEVEQPLPTGDGEEGDSSDRESDFAATKKAVRVEAGKPVAAKGLRITTFRPQLSRFTRVMSPIDEAIARIGFNREGKAETVKLIRPTGNRDKDRPLIDALHKWRATGKPLEQLQENREPRLIEIEFRVIF